MQSTHVIVGAGPVGSSTAAVLATAGHRVRLVTRSGSGPRHDGIELVAADANDADRLTALARGGDALYNCANPPYHRWPQLWPPLAAALLTAAERTGAVLVTMGNLYGYGPVDGPMTEATPLGATSVKGAVRARLWQDALAAHRAGRVRVTEARASDFLGTGGRAAAPAGPGPGFGLLTDMVLARALAGRRVYVPADPDAPHTWTYLPDVARTLAVLGTDPRAWGRPWNVPSPPPVSLREAARQACALIGAPAPRITPVGRPVVRLAGVFSAMLRELPEMSYQFYRRFELDSTAATSTFGLAPTPFHQALAETVDDLCREAGVPAPGTRRSAA